MKKTKIVATIGPASANRETLKSMIEAGMNVVRINFSHGTHESNGELLNSVKELRKEMETPVGIMADFQGPRIRIAVDKEVEIKKGEIIKVSDISFVSKSKIQNPKSQINFKSQIQNSKNFLLDWPGIIQDIQVGNNILIEDGLMRIRITKKEKDYLEAEVLEGGTVKNHKGVNIPDAKLSFGAMTDKDEADLKYALEQDVDFVAFSFVSNGREIEEIREKIKKALGREKSLPQIISKIERKEAIKNIDEIIEASDVIMVARGDLGIEMDESKVVIYQKEIIAKCLKAVKPVIVATQMLDSMIENPIPTRAEVSDVSNAVIDHTDAVMLSGESANGKYPVKAVEMMSEIIESTEESPFDDMASCEIKGKISDYASIISSACQLARNPEIKATVIFTETGFTAKLMSNHRTQQIIVAATSNPKTYQQLALVWGVKVYFFPEGQQRDEMVKAAISQAKNNGQLKDGDKIVVILGEKSGKEGASVIGIRTVE